MGQGGICVVREPDYEENRLVRTKTFSTHDEPKIAMSCANRAFLLTGKILTTGLVASKCHFVF